MSYQRDEIETMVRQVVNRVLGQSPAPSSRRPILDATAVQQMPPASIQAIAPDTLITPLARQVALERRIRLDNHPSPIIRKTKSDSRTVALGADHGGYPLKEQLKQMLETAVPPYTIIDCGTHSADSVDYPDFAYAVAQLVADGRAWRGIIIDGAGIGSCMAANKVPGARAAMCYDQATAVNSREHNNANILTLGAGLIGPNLAQQITNTWLVTDFGGGRHARRVDKINQIDKRFKKT